MFGGPDIVPEQQLSAAEEPVAAPVVADYRKEIQPLLTKHCLDCHGADTEEGGLNLEAYTSIEQIQADREKWEKVFDMIEIGAMPPSDVDQPTDAEKELLTSFLDHTLFYVECDPNTDPGRVTIQRLNQAEYENTIRDLMGVEVDVSAEFPTDDVGYGFDNIGDVLSVQPLLVEKYLDAAEKVASSAILTSDPDFVSEMRMAKDLDKDGSVGDGRMTRRSRSRTARCCSPPN